MRANLPLSTRSIFLIAAILLIPTTLVFAGTTVINCADTDGFCEGTDDNDSMQGTSEIELIKAKKGIDLIFGLGNEGGVSPEELMGGEGGDEIVGDDDVLGSAPASRMRAPGARYCLATFAVVSGAR